MSSRDCQAFPRHANCHLAAPFQIASHRTVLRIGVWIAFILIAALGRAQLANSPWPKFQGGAQSIGLGSGVGATNTVKWSHSFGNSSAGRSAPAIGPDGTIYIGCSDSNVYALDGGTGVLKWTFATGGAVNTSPAVGKDGTVYVGSADAHLYAINGSTGAVRWSYDAIGPIQSSPAIGLDGTVFFGGGALGSAVIALDGATGAPVWTFTARDTVVSSPAIAVDGTVFVGSTDSNLYALDGDTGIVKWSYATGGQVQSSPSVSSDGTVYVGSVDGKLYALNGATGALKFSFATGGPIYSSPAIGPDGSVYVGSNDSSVYAVNGSTGASLWSYVTAGSVVTSPVIAADGTVYAGSNDGKVVALKGASGSVVWTFATGAGIGFGAAIGSDGALFVPSFDGRLYALASSYVPPTLASLTLSPTTVSGGQTSTATVSLSGIPTFQGAVIGLSSSNASALVPTTAVVQPGQVSATFQIQCATVAKLTTSTITATYGGKTVTATVSINPPTLVAVGLNPVSVAGGISSTGTVSLVGEAPVGGLKVALASYYGTASVPSAVTVAAGQTVATFPIATTAVGYQEISLITATLNGVSDSAVLIIAPPVLSSIALNPSTINGGGSTVGTLTLSGNAPVGGFIVKLSSTSGATVPASVLIPAGKYTANFNVSTSASAKQQTATITATQGSTSLTATLTINPQWLKSLQFSPSAVTGGSSSTGSVMLTSPAPVGGLTITLTNTQAAAIVPATVNIGAGKTSATFSVNTTPVVSSVNASIVASVGTASATGILAINAPALTSLKLNPTTVTGGKSSTGTVTISGPAPTAGLVVMLSSNLSAATVPKSITIAAGKTTGVFAVSTFKVTSTESATISATAGGSSKSVNLTLH